MLILSILLFPGDTVKIREFILEIIEFILVIIRGLALIIVVIISLIFDIINVITFKLNFTLIDTAQFRSEGWTVLQTSFDALNDLFEFTINLGANNPVENPLPQLPPPGHGRI